MKKNGWIGVDFDGTLAHYEGYKGAGILGEPIMPMVDRVKKWLADGKTVKVMTARASRSDDPEKYNDWITDCLAIQNWCEEHLGQKLEVTCVKDQGMEELWDDRAVRIIKNTGMISDGSDIEKPEAGDIGAVM
jgi:hypothetical protein